MGYQLLEQPYTRKQIETIQNTAGSMSGIISVDLHELIDNDFEGLMDIAEERLIAEGVLGDITYKIVGTGLNNSIHLYVDGVVELF
jgi:hypothetical protein